MISEGFLWLIFVCSLCPRVSYIAWYNSSLYSWLIQLISDSLSPINLNISVDLSPRKLTITFLSIFHCKWTLPLCTYIGLWTPADYFDFYTANIPSSCLQGLTTTMRLARPVPSELLRDKRLNKSQTNSMDCWLYTGSVNSDGYGQVSKPSLFNSQVILIPPGRSCSNRCSSCGQRRILTCAAPVAVLKLLGWFIESVIWLPMAPMQGTTSHTCATNPGASTPATWWTRLLRWIIHERDVLGLWLAPGTTILWWTSAHTSHGVSGRKETMCIAV